MKKPILIPFIHLMICLLFYTIKASGQIPGQTVRGGIMDTDTHSPISGAEVIIHNSAPLKGEVTNQNGEFRLEGVAVGRIDLLVSYSEEMNRPIIGFNDAELITSSFAGVTNSGTGGHDIIVRGNPPRYMQWRLVGVPITNPNPMEITLSILSPEKNFLVCERKGTNHSESMTSSLWEVVIELSHFYEILTPKYKLIPKRILIGTTIKSMKKTWRIFTS